MFYHLQDTDRSGSNLLHSTLQLEVGSKLLESSGVVRKASQPEQLELPPDEKNDDNSPVLLEEDQVSISTYILRNSIKKAIRLFYNILPYLQSWHHYFLAVPKFISKDFRNF